MIRVWHLKDSAPRDDMCRLTSPGDKAAELRPFLAGTMMFNGCYEVVATMPDAGAADLEHAWYLTNNVESSWSMEPGKGLQPAEPAFHEVRDKRYGRRSSMVGDIFQVDDKFMVVDTFGFTPVPVEGT